ncbi:hypothetical protein [Jannaschia ovalis]|uniref:Uncharacterized protein n=1 Tax=Jannaschia ovalis TaxID=3038773 RepID=A0ABY8LCJ5_9RHOB|nr:hypothetical protein [Jannaschia sp. GRR-S6-38]WGH79043.1 hypothetical protein P8627_01925 [Jannaschia sp. GRR-S6-38]
MPVLARALWRCPRTDLLAVAVFALTLVLTLLPATPPLGEVEVRPMRAVSCEAPLEDGARLRCGLTSRGDQRAASAASRMVRMLRP